MDWFEDQLRQRLDQYRRHDVTFPVSIKLRVTGDFEYQMSVNGRRLLYEVYESIHRRHDRPPGSDRRHDIHIERHESGPEIIAYCTLGTAVLLTAKAVIELVTTIIKARSEGKPQGGKREPVELIVRGFDANGKMFEEKVLEIDPGDQPTDTIIEKALNGGLQKALPPTDPPPVKDKTPAKRKPTPRAKKAKKASKPKK